MLLRVGRGKRGCCGTSKQQRTRPQQAQRAAPARHHVLLRQRHTLARHHRSRHGAPPCTHHHVFVCWLIFTSSSASSGWSAFCRRTLILVTSVESGERESRGSQRQAEALRLHVSLTPTTAK